MKQSERLKLDVRVRNRMAAQGALKADELEQHLAGLPDREAESEALELQQPALGDGTDGATAPAPGLLGAEAGSDEDLEAP